MNASLVKLSVICEIIKTNLIKLDNIVQKINRLENLSDKM